MTDDINPSAVQQHSKQPKIITFAEPRVLFLRDKYGRVDRHEFWGETSRSRVAGGKHPWSMCKYAKAGYSLATEQAYEEYVWACRNKHNIIRKLERFDTDYAVWSKIAELIGYAEEPER